MGIDFKIVKKPALLLLSIIMIASLAFMMPLENVAYADDGTGGKSTSLTTGIFSTQDAIDDTKGQSGIEEDVVKPKVYHKLGIKQQSRTDFGDWGNWSSSSYIKSGNGSGVNGIALRLVRTGNMSGHIAYKTYNKDTGWQVAARDGNRTNDTSQIEAVRIRITGEVTQHYDVYYRVDVAGRGWQPWVRNNMVAGIIGQNTHIAALQVVLSPKTMEALNGSLTDPGIFYATQNSVAGMTRWKKNGAQVGGNNGLFKKIQLNLDAGDMSGGVQYSVFANGGWSPWVKNGTVATNANKKIEAIRVRLTGKIAREYDVYYRSYIKGYGWLDWASNGGGSGSSNFGMPISAFSISLIKKSDPKPSPTTYPTMNKLEGKHRLNGIDIASWQAGIEVPNVAGDFVIVKATGATGYVNPYFREWADATLACGKLLGLYHYARDASNPGSATAEANHFLNHARPYIGKAILVLDFEGEALSLPDPVRWAKKFLDTIYKRTGVRPLIYLSQSVTHSFDWSPVASKYKLWVAQYLYRNFDTGYLANPDGGTDLGHWDHAQMYQYSSTGWIPGYWDRLDLNKFYGSPRMWKLLARRS